MSLTPSPRPLVALDVLFLCALKLAVGAWVLGRGFTHISDDDYARTVIAEQFAHAPRLDPSGTSWLPLPFWVVGAAMQVAGRSLWVARSVAVVLGAASVGAPYLAMRWICVPRVAAVLAVTCAMALPWDVWLGVATVPEGWAGALVASAAIAMGSAAARPWASGALLVASLSRYEAWPACVALWALCAGHMVHAGNRRREAAWAIVATAGPLAWMAWNAHEHGSALHFLTRVSAFRHAAGAADMPLRQKLLGYPGALFEETPEVTALGIAGAAGMAASERIRARWWRAAATAVAIIVFLVWGDVQDAAPTHHPVRALAAVWWILVGMGLDTVFVFLRTCTVAWRRLAWYAAGAVAIAWCASLPQRWDASPGRFESERRDAQVARGFDLRSRDVAAALIAPCSFEHFALIAAWGAPERAEVQRSTGETPTRSCPKVMER